MNAAGLFAALNASTNGTNATRAGVTGAFDALFAGDEQGADGAATNQGAFFQALLLATSAPVAGGKPQAADLQIATPDASQAAEGEKNSSTPGALFFDADALAETSSDPETPEVAAIGANADEAAETGEDDDGEISVAATPASPVQSPGAGQPEETRWFPPGHAKTEVSEDGSVIRGGSAQDYTHGAAVSSAAHAPVENGSRGDLVNAAARTPVEGATRGDLASAAAKASPAAYRGRAEANPASTAGENSPETGVKPAAQSANAAGAVKLDAVLGGNDDQIENSDGIVRSAKTGESEVSHPVAYVARGNESPPDAGKTLPDDRAVRAETGWKAPAAGRSGGEGLVIEGQRVTVTTSANPAPQARAAVSDAPAPVGGQTSAWNGLVTQSVEVATAARQTAPGKDQNLRTDNANGLTARGDGQKPATAGQSAATSVNAPTPGAGSPPAPATTTVGQDLEAAAPEVGLDTLEIADGAEPVRVREHAPATTPVPVSTDAAAPHTRALAANAGAETVSHLAGAIHERLGGAKATRFQVELDPVGLGRVDVRVEINARGELTAALSFENPHAAHELRARAGELQTALQQAGFDLAKTSLHFDAGRHFGQSGFEGQRDQGGRSFAGGGFTDLSANPETMSEETSRRVREGGVDVRI